MNGNCICKSDCVCNKVVVESHRIIEQVFLTATANNILECRDNLEEFCDKKGYVIDCQTMHYNYSGAFVSMSVIARKYGKLEVPNADL